MNASGFPELAVAGIILLIMLISFGILSAILNHHWSRYEIDADRYKKVRNIYYAGAGAILILMFATFAFILI
jgi:hypothetical protein